MNTMTELGVYVLGAVALCLLAVAGVFSGLHGVVLCATVAAGAAYLAQVAAVWTALGYGGWAYGVNLAGFIFALGTWCYGVFLLL